MGGQEEKSNEARKAEEGKWDDVVHPLTPYATSVHGEGVEAQQVHQAVLRKKKK
jgi:nitric oxide synthase oxygenase domain/subunit